MKAIQITVDDRLLARVDRHPDAKRLGRSALFRRAVEAYLREHRRTEIAEAYRRAYGRGRGKKDDDLEGWEQEGAWPEP
jgi:metal-responsive CopG/Arc/MetJ family transcriptional regulator